MVIQVLNSKPGITLHVSVTSATILTVLAVLFLMVLADVVLSQKHFKITILIIPLLDTL